MKPVIIIAIAFVLLSITISPVMADEYDDAAAKCPTYECQQAIMNQKMNAALSAGYDPMQEGVAEYNTNVNRATTWLTFGDEQLDNGNFEEAILFYKNVLDLNLGGEYNAAAHIGLGLAYFELKEWEKALENMRYVEHLEGADEYIEFAQNELDKINQPIKCGKGTIDKNGQCVPDPNYKSKGGGCLIATATYGSELAPQVQQLRELRDNYLLNTESGTSFMNSFNDFYYSFSPVIADYERENPVFKEMVKIAITPMISSLSILNYVDMDSEIEVLGYGISLILLNIGMYVGIPAIVIMRIRK